MIASERFMLDRLKSLCEDVIRRDIDLDNCIGILVASHRHRAGNLKEIALEYILHNLSNGTIRNGLAVSGADSSCCEVSNISVIQMLTLFAAVDFAVTYVFPPFQDLKPEPDLLVEILQRTTENEQAAQRANDGGGPDRPAGAPGAGWADAQR